MKNSCKKENGITLMSLVITIVILLILASIATYSGIEVIKSSKLTKFTTEMKIMQTQVNELYQKMQDGDTTIKELGKIISEIGNQTQVNNVFNAVGITTKDEREQYKYFDKDTIKKLNIEGVSGTFLVNIYKRSVISYEGFKDGDEIYYTIDQLPNSLYNVDYEDKKGKVNPPTFDTNVEKISEGKWKVTVSDISYDGYIDKWQVKYKLNNQDNWNTSEDLNFVVNEEGKYLIKIVNENVESDEKEITIYEYQLVEYIESDGTQWIDTGYIRNENTSKIGITFDSTFYETGWYDLFGDEGGSLRLFLRLTSKTSAKIYETTGGGINVNINNGINHIVIDLINCKAQVNENTINLNSIGNSNLNVYLFTQHYGGTLSQYTRGARIFNMYICEGDNIVRNFVPCYRKFDKEVGMYDTINNKFYINQGTGTFKKGNNVND